MLARTNCRRGILFFLGGAGAHRRPMPAQCIAPGRERPAAQRTAREANQATGDEEEQRSRRWSTSSSRRLRSCREKERGFERVLSAGKEAGSLRSGTSGRGGRVLAHVIPWECDASRRIKDGWSRIIGPGRLRQNGPYLYQLNVFHFPFLFKKHSCEVLSLSHKSAILSLKNILQKSAILEIESQLLPT